MAGLQIWPSLPLISSVDQDLKQPESVAAVYHFYKFIRCTVYLVNLSLFCSQSRHCFLYPSIISRAELVPLFQVIREKDVPDVSSS